MLQDDASDGPDHHQTWEDRAEATPISLGGMNALRLPAFFVNLGHSSAILTTGGGKYILSQFGPLSENGAFPVDVYVAGGTAVTVANRNFQKQYLCLVMATGECPQNPAPLPDTFPAEDVQYNVLQPMQLPDNYVHNVSLHWHSCTERCADFSAGQTDNGNTVQLWKCYDEEVDQRGSIPVGARAR